MSSPNARPEVVCEYEEAKETARVYLRAVGVLEPEGTSNKEFGEHEKKALMLKYREREGRILWSAIVKGGREAIELPDDPSARDAAKLGRRYLHHGYDSEILCNLLKKAPHHPVYHWALVCVACEMVKADAKLPEPLQKWLRKHEKVEKRWRREAARTYRIGLVVDAMATGSDNLVLCGENERRSRQLQVDLQAVCQQLGGKSVRDLYAEHASRQWEGVERWYEKANAYVLKCLDDTVHVLENLNGMRTRPWRHFNGRNRGLTASDLVKLTNQPGSERAGVNAIESKTTVRYFSKLKATRSDATADKAIKDDDIPRSICDAMSEVLRDNGHRAYYETVRDAWMAYRRDGLPHCG